MSAQVTLGQLVKFVLDNRKGNAFRGYSEEAIAGDILRGAHEGTMFYSTREDGSIAGVVTCFKEDDSKILHVNDLLTTEPWALGNFVRYFAYHFPNFTIAAMRRNKPVIYKNTMKLCNKLLKGKV